MTDVKLDVVLEAMRDYASGKQAHPFQCPQEEEYQRHEACKGNGWTCPNFPDDPLVAVGEFSELHFGLVDIITQGAKKVAVVPYEEHAWCYLREVQRRRESAEPSA